MAAEAAGEDEGQRRRGALKTPGTEEEEDEEEESGTKSGEERKDERMIPELKDGHTKEVVLLDPICPNLNPTNPH